jgi:hypothetical protein
MAVHDFAVGGGPSGVNANLANAGIDLRKHHPLSGQLKTQIPPPRHLRGNRSPRPMLQLIRQQSLLRKF